VSLEVVEAIPGGAVVVRTMRLQVSREVAE
jgi:hypothetical protein